MYSSGVVQIAGIVAAVLLAGTAGGCASCRTRDQAEHVVAARQLTHRGLDALQQNHWAVAEQMFREAVEASPHDEQARFQYAKTLWHRQESAAALRHMAEAVHLSGNAPDLLVELGQMYLAVGQVTAAEQQAQLAAAADPQHAAAHALLGDVRRYQGRWQLALQQYHWALDIDPTQTRVKIAVAELYQQHAEPRRALASLQDLTLDQVSAEEAQQVLLFRGLAHLQLGRSRDAIACLGELQRRVPDDARVLCHLAEAHWDAGEYTAARRCAEEAVARQPDLPQSRALLARIDESHPRVVAAGAR